MSYLQRLLDGYVARTKAEETRRKQRQTDPSKSIFVQRINKRIAKKQDARIVITGEGGIGKSTLELRLGELLDPRIYVEQQEMAVNEATSFTAKEYMNGVRTLPSQSQLSFDEPGQAWYHRQFMSEVNMILAKTVLGFRYKKFKSVLTVPNIDLLDLDAIRLIQYMIFVSQQGKAEVFKVMIAKFGGPPWYKKIIDKLTFTKPDTKLWHLYEKRKFAIQDQLYDRYGKRLDDLDKPELTNTEIITLIQENPKKFNKAGKLYVPYLQKEFKIGLNRGYLIKAVLETDAQQEEKADSL